MNKQQLVLASIIATTLVACLIGCVEQVYVKREYHVGVKLANTPEALRCKTECLALVSQSKQICTTYEPEHIEVRFDSSNRMIYHIIVNKDIYIHEVMFDGFASKFGCYGLISDCFLSCPGSSLDKTDTPKIVITTKHIDEFCNDKEYSCDEGYECIGYVKGKNMGQCIMTTVESIR